MEKIEILDALKHANQYIAQLDNLNKNLDYAEDQISKTAEETRRCIIEAFETLLSTLQAALCSRREELLQKNEMIKQKGLLPLTECRRVVSKNISDTNNFISLGRELMKESVKEKLGEFVSRSSLLGTLPEIPQLKEVPSLSFQYDLCRERELIDVCNSIGSVTPASPVQISYLKEQPGALLIKWKVQEHNEDHVYDIQQFELQKAFGNTVSDTVLQNNFRTCYIGRDTRHLVKELLSNQEYTFRVRCKYEGDVEWSPWSLPETGITKVTSFFWVPNENFQLYNENKMATPVNCSAMLFSNKFTFEVGYSVEFTFLECDTNLNNTYLGLFATTPITYDEIMKSESICVEATGSIYESGSKKSTQFPAVARGTKISFTCEAKENGKLRISIDAYGRRVTYDWIVDETAIYFGAKFNSTKWKIMIE